MTLARQGTGPLGLGKHGSGLEPQAIQKSLLPDALCELMTEAKAILQIAGTERCGYCKLSGGKLQTVLLCNAQYVAYYWFTKLSQSDDGRFGVSTVELIAVKTFGRNASAAMYQMGAALAEQNSLDVIATGRSSNWDVETTRIKAPQNDS